MSVLQAGRQTWLFAPAPLLLGCGAVVGKREGEGPLAADFDVIHKDNYLGQKALRLPSKSCWRRPAM